MNKYVVILSALLCAVLCFACGDNIQYYESSDENDAVSLPILMYHHIDENGDDSVTISESLFEEHLEYLSENNYNAVSLEQLVSFVENGTPLPERPVLITFDDGYDSNYTIAFELLRKYDFCAAIFVIGSYVGDTPGIIKHFDWTEAREMVDSGQIEIENHTYDMHMNLPPRRGRFADSLFRPDVLRCSKEDPISYTQSFIADYIRCQSLILQNLGYIPTAFAYPHGRYSDETESLLTLLGAKITLTTKAGVNLIRRGEPESLRLLKRFNINQTTGIPELRVMLGE